MFGSLDPDWVKSTTLSFYYTCKKFCNEDISLQRKEDSREVSVLENEKLKKMVGLNPRITFRELAEELRVNVGIVSKHFKVL
uniref:Winged helix-turn-helix transcriptional regulator n=1 Tax=Strongyloides venezuelensis TaxID=75913 RepID=A0A0K0G5X9_STRVS